MKLCNLTAVRLQMWLMSQTLRLETYQLHMGEIRDHAAHTFLAILFSSQVRILEHCAKIQTNA